MLIIDHKYISWTFFIVTVLTGFYKVYKFKIPTYLLELEILLLIILHILNQTRLYIAIKSNKTETTTFWSATFFVCFSILTICGFVFFLLLQTYVLLLEFLVVGIALLFSVIEFGFTIFAILDFKSYEYAQ